MKVVNIDDYRRPLEEPTGILLSIFDSGKSLDKPLKTIHFPQLVNLHYASDISDGEMEVASLGLLEKGQYCVVPVLLDCMILERPLVDNRFIYKLRKLFYPNINEGLEELGLESLIPTQVAKVVGGPPVFITFSRMEVLKAEPPRF